MLRWLPRRLRRTRLADCSYTMSLGIGIVTISGDAHAYVIATKLRSDRNVRCHVFEMDKVSDAHSFSIRPAKSYPSASLTDALGTKVDLSELRVCWWRRVARSQSISREVDDDRLRHVIDSACVDGISGSYLAAFQGTFVSDPIRTALAENKVVQLAAAVRAGLKTPKTLVSNSTSDIINFAQMLPNGLVIAKALGRTTRLIDTKQIAVSELNLDEVRMVPSIFQEFIAGRRHIRANVFGKQIFSVAIDCDAVDWRRELPDHLQEIKLPADVQERLLKTVETLGLRMGIIDMKIDEQGEYVFFEINPQGQFLFLEPLSGIPFTTIFADFLVASARSSMV